MYRRPIPLTLTLLVAGCVPVQPVPPMAAGPDPEVLALRDQLAATHAAMLEVTDLQASDTARLQRQLRRLSATLVEMPDRLAAACAPAPATEPVAASRCEPADDTALDNKMLLGELENVWIDPPGVSLVARIDTGVQTNTIYAENTVEFERDGDRWVRFDLAVGDDTAALERPLLRHVRTGQTAASNGNRRPVVTVRVLLGDLRESFEFTVEDHAHPDHGVLLGRNFLTDIALVDVARKFVQPPFAGGSG